MAAPNLNSTSLIVVAAMDRVAPSGSGVDTTLTTNAAASGHTFITLSLTIANISAVGVTARVNYFDGTNNNEILFDAVVPGTATIECAPTRKFLLEGATIKVQVGTANQIKFTHHYLDCH